jgi:glycosyltransferase involved in cell wall biosynthesis
VVIPTKDRKKETSDCIQSVIEAYRYFRRLYSKEIEIVIVDDHSKQEPNFGEFQGDIKIFKNKGIGHGAARNFGIEVSKGAYIAFVDSDCIVAEDWLVSIYEHFNNHKDCIAIQGNPWLYSNPQNYLTGIESKVYKHVVEINLNRKNNSLNTLEAKNMAIRKAALKKYNNEKFFREELPSMVDREAGSRAARIGKICWLPEAVVYHKQIRSLFYVMTHNFWYGRGTAYFGLREDCQGGSVLDNYIMSPIRNGIPAWYVLLLSGLFVMGNVYERILKAKRVHEYLSRYGGFVNDR